MLGGRAAGVREGIEQDVDLAVQVQVGVERPARHQAQAVGRNAECIEAAQQLTLGFGVGHIAQQQSRARHGVQHPAPGRHHGRAELAHAVQAAEGDMPTLQRGQRVDLGGLRVGLKGPAGVQAHQLLDIARVDRARRRAVHVAKVVVHRHQPRRLGVADPAGLHRRRLAGKGQQAVAHGMARQIDQDVDAVGLNLLH